MKFLQRIAPMARFMATCSDEGFDNWGDFDASSFMPLIKKKIIGDAILGDMIGSKTRQQLNGYPGTKTPSACFDIFPREGPKALRNCRSENGSWISFLAKKTAPFWIIRPFGDKGRTYS